MKSEFSRLIGDVTVLATCDEELSERAEILFLTLQQAQREGFALEDGAKLRYGWSTLTLQSSDAGLNVCEPDFDTDPFNAIRPDVSVSLRVEAQQRALVARLPTEVTLFEEDVHYSDTLVAAKGRIADRRIYLERCKPTRPRVSGWYLGPVEGEAPDREDPSAYECLPTYRLLHLRPVVLQALTLPTGYLVVINGDALEAVVADDDSSLL